MYIKNIKLKNYKCFKELNNGNGIDLGIPDKNNLGSGLNIFIGENNTGKTALLSSISKLRANSNFYDEDKFKGGDVEIKIENTNQQIVEIKNIPGSNNIENINLESYLKFDDIYFVKDNRIWISNFNSNNMNSETYHNIYSQNNSKRQDIDNYLSSRLSSIEKNENDKKLEINEYMKKIIPNFTDWYIRGTSKGGNFIAYKMSNGEIFDIDFSLGGGILSLFKIIVGIVDGRNIIIIDEPEAYLHPNAQINLLKILLEQSKDKQIIITTHSPYFFKNLSGKNSSLFIFKRNENDNIIIENIGSNLWGIFGKNSPTWGEINYYAYDLPTIEFHNELYGYIQEHAISENKNNCREKGFDGYLLEKLGKKDSDRVEWTKEKGGKEETVRITKQVYIRNKIHHPENKHNDDYTEEELRKSIEEMIDIANREIKKEEE